MVVDADAELDSDLASEETSQLIARLQSTLEVEENNS